MDETHNDDSYWIGGVVVQIDNIVAAQPAAPPFAVRPKAACEAVDVGVAQIGIHRAHSERDGGPPHIGCDGLASCRHSSRLSQERACAKDVFIEVPSCRLGHLEILNHSAHRRPRPDWR